MAQAIDCLSPSEVGSNDGQPFLAKPKSYDFCGKRELDWSRIETEIHSIAVEIIGRGATERVHGESLTDVFGFLADDICGDIERLKELLGLGREVRS